MLVKRKAIIVASSAFMALAVPIALLADDNAKQSSPPQNQASQNNDRSDSHLTGSGKNQDSQDAQKAKISGTVQSYHDVNVNGDTHFRVRVKESNGQTKSVDLGDCDRCSDLIDNLEQGDQITAYGNAQKIDGKNVFVAERASVDGKSYSIGEAGDESHEADQSQSGNESEAPRARESTAQNRKDQKNAQNQKPSTVLLLDERMVFVGEGDLNRHLIMAKEDLRLGDGRDASGELRVAADRIDLYANASHERGEATNLLNQSRQDLTQLADQIAKNSDGVKSREIDAAAAQAQAALAKYYDEQIQGDGAKDRPIETGYNLQAAAVHAREAMVWSDEHVSDHAASTIQTAFKAADDLLSGNQKDGANPDQVAQNLNQQIDRLDKSLNQSADRPASSQMKSSQQSNKDHTEGEKQQQDHDGSQAKAD